MRDPGQHRRVETGCAGNCQADNSGFNERHRHLPFVQSSSNRSHEQHRSNIARAMILLIDDMQILLTAQREYASGLCLNDTQEMRLVLTRCYIRPVFNVELHFSYYRDRSTHS
jgi:hypothetical protein